MVSSSPGSLELDRWEPVLSLPWAYEVTLASQFSFLPDYLLDVVFGEDYLRATKSTGRNATWVGALVWGPQREQPCLRGLLLGVPLRSAHVLLHAWTWGYAAVAPILAVDRPSVIDHYIREALSVGDVRWGGPLLDRPVVVPPAPVSPPPARGSTAVSKASDRSTRYPINWTRLEELRRTPRPSSFRP